MNTILNIQVKLAAKEAQAMIQQLSASIRQLTATKGGSLGSLTAGASAASKSAVSGQASVDRQAAAAAKQAASAQKAAQKQVDDYLKNAWKQQTLSYKDAQKAQEAAAKETSKTEIAQAKLVAQAQKEAMKAANAPPVTSLTSLGKLSEYVSGPLDTMHRGILQAGKDMQWIGRQINFNFTLPLALAAKTIVGFELSNERAFTRIVKVYSGAKDQLPALQKALENLSNQYGVSQADVDQLGASWAAAGAKGADLVKVVQTSLNLSILGNYDDVQSTFEDLVTVMGAFHLTADQLAGSIAILNTVDNEAATTLPDMVAGIARSAGAAQVAGVGIRELSAMIAVLTPAFGSATAAGNSLKTIFSKLSVPTDEMNRKFKLIGVNIDGAAWKTGNATQKLQILADKFGAATDGGKAFIASIVAGQFQISRADALLADLSDKTGNYAKIMESITPNKDPLNIDKANQQIQTLLKSNPQKITIVMNQIKNMMTDAIIPLIPTIATALNFVAGIVQWFVRLGPGAQKAAAGVLILVVAMGILAQFFGSVQLVFGTFLKFLIGLVSLIPGIGLTSTTAAAEVGAASAAATEAIGSEAVAATGAVASQAEATSATLAAFGAEAVAGVAAVAAAASVEVETAAATMEIWPFVLAAAITAAIIVLAIVFRKQIAQFIRDTLTDVKNYVKEGFALLPKSVAAGLQAVLDTIKNFMKAIVKAMSYLNPFARHSPSLVDNVTAGIDEIIKQYGRLANIGQVFSNATSDLNAFAAATKNVLDSAEAKKRAEDLGTIAKASPQAVPIALKLYADRDALTAQMAPVTAAVNAQTIVVAGLKTQYDEAQKAVDDFTRTMAPLKKIVDDSKTALDEAQQKLTDFSNTNVIGMKAAADATFENTMAQKRLQLQIAELTDSGQSLDDILQQISLINGEMENTQGTLTRLQQGGAGSDITNVYKKQLDALKAQKVNLQLTADAGSSLTDQLKALQHQADIMDLTTSLKFDPLKKQIQDLADTTKEMSFDEIIQGMKDQRTIVDQLTTSYNINKAALDLQQGVLDALSAKRDSLKDSYDAENQSLGILNDRLDEYKAQIGAIDDALSAVITAQGALSKGAGGAGGTGGPDVTDPTPPAIDTGDLKIPDFQPFKFDPWQMFKDAWAKFVKWWGDTVVPWWERTALPFLKGLPDRALAALAGFGDVGWQMGIAIMASFTGWLATAATGLMITGLNIILGVKSGIDQGILVVVAQLSTLGITCLNAVGDASIWLLQTGINVMVGLVTGFTQGVVAVYIWLTTLPGVILAFFGGGIGWLVGPGGDVIQGFINGITETAKKIWSWFLSLPTIIQVLFLGAVGWLWGQGSAILIGLGNGIQAQWANIWWWLGQVPGWIISVFNGAINWLWNEGVWILAGLANGMQAMYAGIAGWLTTLPNGIKAFFAGAIDWLVQTGVNVFVGLLKGMKQGWDAATSWLRTLNPGDWFNDINLEKGHAAVNLLPMGKMVFAGLLQGMKSGWADTAEWLRTLDPSSALNPISTSVSSALASIKTDVSATVTNEMPVRHITLTGDLSFPGITSSDDAETFLTNLEALSARK